MKRVDLVAKENAVVRQLNSRDFRQRCKAITTLKEFGGPGAGPLLSGIIKKKGTRTEKLLAICAIRSISKRTGLYYEDSIGILEQSCGDPSKTVSEAAQFVRNRMPGSQILIHVYGDAKDKRIII